MLLNKSVVVIMLMILLPIILGDLLSKYSGIQEDICISGLMFRYMMGNVLMWAIFQLIGVPLILIKSPFSLAVILWVGIISTCIFVALKKRGRSLLEEMIGFGKRVKEKCHGIRFSKKNLFTLFWMVIAIAFIGIQCYMYIFKMHLDEDDSRYVVNALEAYENNTMLLNNPATGEYEDTWVGELAKDVVSPWMVYLAVLAKIVMIHPAIFIHTVLPPFLIMMLYCAFWLLGDCLFKKNFQDCCVFIAIVAFLNMYFNDSTHTQSFVSMVRIWQGKAVVAGVMIPVLFYLLMLLYQEFQFKKLFVLLFISSMGMSLLSGVGILLSSIMIATYGIWCIFMRREWKMLPWLGIGCIPSAFYGVLYAFIR